MQNLTLSVSQMARIPFFVAAARLVLSLPGDTGAKSMSHISKLVEEAAELRAPPVARPEGVLGLSAGNPASDSPLRLTRKNLRVLRPPTASSCPSPLGDQLSGGVCTAAKHDTARPTS